MSPILSYGHFDCYAIDDAKWPIENNGKTTNKEIESMRPNINVCSLRNKHRKPLKQLISYIMSYNTCFRTITSLQKWKYKSGKVNVLKLRSADDVAVALAKYIANLSGKFIKENGSFSVVLSGGTLIDTLRKLLEPPYRDSIEWSKWLVFFLDERVVPLDHPDSNYKLALDGFLSKVPIPKRNIYAINEKLSAEDAADDYETRLKQLVNKSELKRSTSSEFANFDLMLLGMGPDGHVASLFCWHFERFEKTRWVTFIKDSPKPPSQRITFTFPLINAASEIAMVVTGEDAADAVNIALTRKKCDSGCCFPLPVEKVLPVGNLTWFLDNDAAPGL